MKTVRGRSSDWSVLKPMKRAVYAADSAVSRRATTTVTRGREQHTRTTPRRTRPVCDINDNGGEPLFFARDEALESCPGDVVRPLLGRGLHQPGRRSAEGALDPAIERDLARANGVDHHARGVGRVPDLELQLDVDRLIAEAAALEAD